MKACKHCGSTTRYIAVWMNQDTGEVLRNEHGPALYNGEDYMCGGLNDCMHERGGDEFYTDEDFETVEDECTLIVGPVPTPIVDEWKATLLLDSQDWSGDDAWEVAYDVVISHKLCPMEHGDIDTELAREWAKELLTMMKEGER